MRRSWQPAAWEAGLLKLRSGLGVAQPARLPLTQLPLTWGSILYAHPIPLIPSPIVLPSSIHYPLPVSSHRLTTSPRLRLASVVAGLLMSAHIAS